MSKAASVMAAFLRYGRWKGKLEREIWLSVGFRQARVPVLFGEPSPNERIACRDPSLVKSFADVLLQHSDLAILVAEPLSEVLILNTEDPAPVIPACHAESERLSALRYATPIVYVVVRYLYGNHRLALPAMVILPGYTIFLAVEVDVNIVTIAHLTPPCVYTDFIIELG